MLIGRPPRIADKRMAAIQWRMDIPSADWNAYRVFLAVAHAGSFSAAARKIGSTQPTISRQIEALEKTLGAKLFTRSQRGLQLTSVARQFVPLVEQMETAAAALGRSSTLDRTQESGAVRITSGAQLGIEVLPVVLAEFASQHPAIAIELSITSRMEDLLNRDADIGVRLGRPTQQGLMACRAGKVQIGLFAHRRYLEAAGTPVSLNELAKHRLIGFDRDLHVLHAFGPLARQFRREQFSFRTDQVTAQLALLRAGAGIAACHTHVARMDKHLVPVLPDKVKFVREVWLAMHADLKQVRRVRLLFDHLRGSLASRLRPVT